MSVSEIIGEKPLAFMKAAAALLIAVLAIVAFLKFSDPISERIRAGDDIKVGVSNTGFSLELFSKRVNDLKAAVPKDGKPTTRLSKENWPEWATRTIGQRAERDYDVLLGKTILWIDDLHPTQNAVERRLLRTIGLDFDSVRCIDTAKTMLSLESYDAIIVESSVFKSPDNNCSPPNKTLNPGQVSRSEFVDWLRKKYPEIPVIAYSATIGNLKKDNGVPPGLFGATKFTSELFHLVFDAVERTHR